MIWFSDSRAGASHSFSGWNCNYSSTISLQRFLFKQANIGKLFPYKKAHHVDWNFSSFSEYYRIPHEISKWWWRLSLRAAYPVFINKRVFQRRYLIVCTCSRHLRNMTDVFTFCFDVYIIKGRDNTCHATTFTSIGQRVLRQHNTRSCSIYTPSSRLERRMTSRWWSKMG